MASAGKITVELRIVNPAAVRSLVAARELAETIAEEQPWNEDAKELIAELEIVRRHGYLINGKPRPAQ